MLVTEDREAEHITVAHKIVGIISIILFIIMIPILTVNITLIVKSYINPDKVADFMGYKAFIVTSGSMEGTIEVGDLIITKNIMTDKLKVGDIISYHSGNSVITHRITKISRENDQLAFTTKGDANNIEDPTSVQSDQLEGIYVGRASGMGDAALFLQKPQGMLICVGIPILLFIGYDMMKRRLDKKRDKEKMELLQEELRKLRDRKDEDYEK